jgi:hypothetical protein
MVRITNMYNFILPGDSNESEIRYFFLSGILCIFAFLIIHFVEEKNRGGDDDDTYLVG